MAGMSSPKKFPRGQPKYYSTCLLYNSREASQRLKGLTFAACNPKLEKNPKEEDANNVEEGLCCLDIHCMHIFNKMRFIRVIRSHIYKDYNHK